MATLKLTPIQEILMLQEINIVTLTDIDKRETLDLGPRTKEDKRLNLNKDVKPHQLRPEEGQVTFFGTQLEDTEQLLIV